MFLFIGTFFQGWWGGPFAITAGGLGLSAVRTKDRSMTNACGAMSIVSAVVALAAATMAFLIATDNDAGAIATGAIMGLAFLVEIGVGIDHGVVCLGPGCNTAMPPPPAPGGQPATTVVYQTGGQPGVIMPQTGAYAVQTIQQPATQQMHAYPPQQVVYQPQQQGAHQLMTTYPPQHMVPPQQQAAPPDYQPSLSDIFPK